MGQTTFANSRGIAHKKSGGMSIAFPDVCKTPTPGGPIPMPYPNLGMASDTSKGPQKVKSDASMPMTKGAKYSMSSGDEAGNAGGGLSPAPARPIAIFGEHLDSYPPMCYNGVEQLRQWRSCVPTRE